MNMKTVLISIATLMIAACASTSNDSALSAAEKSERSAALTREQMENAKYRRLQWEDTSSAREDLERTDLRAEQKQRVANPRGG